MTGLLPRKFKDRRRYSFARTFGSAIELKPLDLDKGICNFDQNRPNTLTGDPALYNGCTAFSRTDIATNEDRIVYKPGFTYTKSCLIAGVREGNPLPMEAAFKSGIVYGLQALGEMTDEQALTHRRGPYFEVHPVGSQDFFDALWSAMQIGQRGISIGTPWFPELTLATMTDTVLLRPTSDWHCWEALGIELVEGRPMLKVKAHTGDFKWFSRAVVNQLLSVSGTDCLTDTHGKALPTDIALVQLNIRQLMLNYCYRAVALVQNLLKREVPIIPPPMTPQQTLYQAAKNSLGKHMTLNNAVPAKVGCAEAVSAVLKLVGVSDGPQGIASTAALGAWLEASPLFESIGELEQGAVLLFETGSGNGSIEGHVFICAAFGVAFPNDWGLMSNDSATGLFLERWNWTRAKAYYQVAGGMPAKIFRLVHIAS